VKLAERIAAIIRDVPDREEAMDALILGKMFSRPGANLSGESPSSNPESNS
jgi:hypothetical protein